MGKLREQKEKLMAQFSEAVGTAPLVEVHGTGELLLSGCLGITDYSPEKVVVSTLGGNFTICGKRLVMSVFRGDILSVEGKIEMICFGV